MVNLVLVYSFVLVATTLADIGYPTLKPDARCKYVGQFLSHSRSRCLYVRCDYGNEPWHDSYGKVKLFAREMACAPGTSVPEYFDSTKKQGNPCTQRTKGGRCKGLSLRTIHGQYNAFLNYKGFKSPFYGGLVGLRGKIPYPHPEPRKYKGPQSLKAENFESTDDYTDDDSSEKDFSSREEFYSKGGFPGKESYSDKQRYEPKGDYGSQEEYDLKGDYFPKEGYPPKGDYPQGEGYPKDYQSKVDFLPKRDFQPKGEYAPKGDYSPIGDYHSEGDYPMKGDYAPGREYKSGGDYDQSRGTYPKGYDNDNNYTPKDDYHPRSDYSSKGSHHPKDDYPEKSGYPHNFPRDNSIHSSKGALFPPGDYHVGQDKYTPVIKDKSPEYMHEDFKKDFDRPFRESFPSSDSVYPSVMRGARKAPAGPYPQAEEMYPTPESSEEEEGATDSHEIDSSSSEEKSLFMDDNDEFPFRKEDGLSSSEREFSQEEPLSNTKGSYHPLKGRFPSSSRVPPRKQEGYRASKTAFPFIKDALNALKDTFPSLEESDPLDKGTFTSKQNPYSPTKGDFRDFPEQKPVRSVPERPDYVKEERYEGPSFRPPGGREFEDRSEAAEEYPKDRESDY